MRRLVQKLRLLPRLLGDFYHRLNEGVQHLLTLGLGGLYHESLGNDEREVDRRRVEAIIHQPLDDVHGVDILGYPSAGEDALVLADAVVGQRVNPLEFGQDVIGRQDGVLARLPQPLGAQHPDVGVSLDADGEVPVEGFHPSDAFLRHPQVIFIPLLDHDGAGQVFGQSLGGADRPAAGASAASPVTEAGRSLRCMCPQRSR